MPDDKINNSNDSIESLEDCSIVIISNSGKHKGEEGLMSVEELYQAIKARLTLEIFKDLLKIKLSD